VNKDSNKSDNDIKESWTYPDVGDLTTLAKAATRAVVGAGVT